MTAASMVGQTDGDHSQHTSSGNAFAPIAAVHALKQRFAEERRTQIPRGRNPVRREAIDYQDERARIDAPLAPDRTVESTNDVRDALWEMLQQLQRETAAEKRYGQGMVTRACLAVFHAMLFDKEAFDFFTCTSDDAVSVIARKAGTSTRSVHRAKKVLRALGVLDWVCRSIATGREKVFGVPQHMMMSCLTYFTPARLKPRLAAMYERILAAKRAARARHEAKTGIAGQRRPIVKRSREHRVIPALVNPRVWLRILDAEVKAKAKAAQSYAAEEARAIAYATKLARNTARE